MGDRTGLPDLCLLMSPPACDQQAANITVCNSAELTRAIVQDIGAMFQVHRRPDMIQEPPVVDAAENVRYFFNLVCFFTVL